MFMRLKLQKGKSQAKRSWGEKERSPRLLTCTLRNGFLRSLSEFFSFRLFRCWIWFHVLFLPCDSVDPHLTVLHLGSTSACCCAQINGADFDMGGFLFNSSVLIGIWLVLCWWFSSSVSVSFTTCLCFSSTFRWETWGCFEILDMVFFFFFPFWLILISVRCYCLLSVWYTVVRASSLFVFFVLDFAFVWSPHLFELAFAF